MTSAFVAGVLAGYGVALPVGAVATYLVGLAARAPWRTSAAAALGVATTDGAYALLASWAGMGLEAVLRPVARPLTVVAAVVLVALGARTVLAGLRRLRSGHSLERSAGPRLRPLRAYLSLTALTAVNPSTLLYFSALVLGGQSAFRESEDAAAAAFAVGALVASASWQLLLAGGGAALGRLVTGPRGQLALAVGSGLIMGALALHLVVG